MGPLISGNHISSSSGTELPLMFESYGLVNIFPSPSILDAGYPIFNLHLTNVLFDVILSSVLGSSFGLLVRGFHLTFWGRNYFLFILAHLYVKC